MPLQQPGHYFARRKLYVPLVGGASFFKAPKQIAAIERVLYLPSRTIHSRVTPQLPL